MDHRYISKDSELVRYVADFLDKGSYVMALDLEAEQNLHAYGERLCLVQIFDGTDGVIVDPLRMSGDALRALFENRGILKVMYDAPNDLLLLQRTYSIRLKSVLDLRPAVDLLDYERQDLHSMIAQELGVRLAGKRKYQRHNWAVRPIQKEALEYALNDVLYLPSLKDILLRRLAEHGLMDRYLLRNLRVQNKDLTVHPDDKYRRVKGYSRLGTTEKAIFKRIHGVREAHAEMYNLPVYRIVRNEDLILASKNAKHLNRIQFPADLGVDGIRRLVTELKAAVRAQDQQTDA